ncbi:Esterase [Trametes pubescens]|uniref:Esterase n=1 Tax=Trametes pubescens TaxID=154538 RepID=A0A1M2VA12_TRAPU|nr:Esterase [Trametes pubescens]
MRWFLSKAPADPVQPSEEPTPSILSKRPTHISNSDPSEALKHYENPGVPPPSSRVGDPRLKQGQREPMRLWHWWKFGAFAAVKATTLAADALSHHLWGPPRKSWGIEMTLLSSMMRGVSRYSHLTDIDTIRMLMSIGGLVPVPSDALITPVTFSVRKRGLRGILEDFDAAEDGTRELCAEWVVGKKTWHRLQAEWKARKEGKFGEKPKRKERVVLYLHGGAYYMFSAATHRLITLPLAKYLDARLFVVNYRLAPETRFPGPLHDAVSAYFRLVDDLHVPPENIVVAGDSAGGGLALALLMYLRDNDYPLPAGAILMSPWVDLTMSCESWESNAQYDIVPMPQPGDHLNPIACYLGEHMEKYLTHPYASPLFGDFKGLPPLLIQAGEVEVLRDEITLLAHKATLAGVEVRHELYEDMVHVFQSLPFLDAAKHAFISCHDFVWSFLPQYQSRTPQPLDTSAEKGLEDEIDNDAARVVRGDGTETGAGREAISQSPKGKRDSGGYRRKRRSVSPTPTLQGDDPSWDSKYISSGSEDEGDLFEGGALRPSRSYTPPPHSPAIRPQIPKRPSLARLRSTFSAIADAATVSASDSIHVDPVHAHGPASADDIAPPPRRRNRLSSLSMTSSVDAPPEPAIRRSQYSHPDITSLCQQWHSSGPANHTTTYKPESPVSSPQATVSRRHSRTLSLSAFSAKRS